MSVKIEGILAGFYALLVVCFREICTVGDRVSFLQKFIPVAYVHSKAESPEIRDIWQLYVARL